MRIIAKKTLQRYWLEVPSAKQQLLAWFDEVSLADWSSPNELKTHLAAASILSDKRVVFNIHGNRHRLVVDIEYRLRLVFIVWVGTHAQYDRLDVRKIKYVKTNSN